MIKFLWIAFESLYHATNTEDEVEPGNAADHALRAYNETWEAICDLVGDAVAKTRFDAFMKALPRSQRSDCYPDGSI